MRYLLLFVICVLIAVVLSSPSPRKGKKLRSSQQTAVINSDAAASSQAVGASPTPPESATPAAVSVPGVDNGFEELPDFGAEDYYGPPF